MSTIAEKIKTFNEILEDLLKQLSPIIGTSYHFYFKKIIKINATLAMQNFLYYAIPLRNKIDSRDETYFTNEDNHRDLTKEYDEGLQEIIRLKGIWEKLDDKSKEGLWDITQVLLHIGTEYIALK
jgi:hypothetical protein